MKISTKIWRPLIDKLDAKLDGACLRRDAYLGKVLGIELPALDSEVCLVNSDASEKFIFERLDQFDRKPVSLSLPDEVVQRLNAICERKRIVRDAFFNRLVLMLAASPKQIDRLFFPHEKDWMNIVWTECKHDGPFFENTVYPLEHDIDPFWAIRMGIDLFSENDSGEELEYQVPETGETVKVRKDPLTENISLCSGLYSDIFHDKVFKDTDLYGFNCYVPDWRVPGHKAEVEYRNKLDELLVDL